MRKIISLFALLLALILVCGCTNSANVQTTSSGREPVEMDVQFTWTKNPDGPDVLTVAGSTNIPDGAALSYGAYDGRYPVDSMDSKYVYSGLGDDEWIVVENGKFTHDIVLTDDFNGDFVRDTVLFSITFAPWSTRQPKSIADYYGHGAFLEADASDPSFIVFGPPADIDKRWYHYEVFVTAKGDSLKVEASNDYFGETDRNEWKLESSKRFKK